MQHTLTQISSNGPTDSDRPQRLPNFGVLTKKQTSNKSDQNIPKVNLVGKATLQQPPPTYCTVASCCCRLLTATHFTRPARSQATCRLSPQPK
jgi:hypothetical protein